MFHLELSKNLWVPHLTFVRSCYTDHQYAPHFHDHYVILAVEKGVNKGICQKKAYEIGAGELLVINPGEIHTGNSLNNGQLIYNGIYVEQDFFKNELPVYSELHLKNAGLCGRFNRLIQAKTAENRLELDENLTLFFESLKHHPAGQVSRVQTDQVQVKKIKDYIEDHFKHNFSLDELSHEVSISSFHLIRLFKQHIGLSPYKYLRNFRIEQAKKLLKRSASLADVAVEVGFYDQSHFHKNFLKIVGTTPKSFQKIQQ